jgi:hypothetical protein
VGGKKRTKKNSPDKREAKIKKDFGLVHLSSGHFFKNGFACVKNQSLLIFRLLYRNFNL